MTTLTFYPMQTYSDSTTSFFAYDPYIETYWLSVLGPTATLLMNDLCMKALVTNEPFSEDAHRLSQRMGTGSRDGSSSPVRKQLSRLVQTGIFTLFNENEYLVPRTIEPLYHIFTQRLTDSQREQHSQWIDRLSSSPLTTGRRRAQQLVCHLESKGIDDKTISSVISTCGLHPSIIGELLSAKTIEGSAA